MFFNQQSKVTTITAILDAQLLPLYNSYGPSIHHHSHSHIELVTLRVQTSPPQYVEVLEVSL